MTYSRFHHLYRLDAPTFQQARDRPGLVKLLQSPQLPESARFLALDPLVFTQAYMLLGESPQRFGSDLSLYLATVQAFFRAANTDGGLSLALLPNPDAKRRLSEDLGVALSSIFMVDLFELPWQSISQLPQNSSLSKKRPDFQGFCPNGDRYLFESKGTTKLASIESSLTKALAQVKAYPEPSSARFAIVSYLSADDRFFPSTSFVVDPPGLPKGVIPDPDTSRSLHFEKVLEFAGLTSLANAYTAVLSAKLAEAQRSEQLGELTFRRTSRLNDQVRSLKRQLEARITSIGDERLQINDLEVVSSRFNDPVTGIAVIWGVAIAALRAGLEFVGRGSFPPASIASDGNTLTSVFDDGTFVRLVVPAGSANE